MLEVVAILLVDNSSGEDVVMTSLEESCMSLEKSCVTLEESCEVESVNEVLMMVLVELMLPVRTSTCPYGSSSGSSKTNGSNRGGDGDEGWIIEGESCDEEQGLISGNSRSCNSMVISSLLMLFLNHHI